MSNWTRPFYTILWILEVLECRLKVLEEKLGVFGYSPSEKLTDIEKESLIFALKRANGIQKDAAKLLGITPRVMQYKIQKYGLQQYSRLSTKR